MRPKEEIFEIEIKVQVNGKETITDYVFYNQFSEITEWLAYSGHVKDYIPVDLKKAEVMWPGMWHKLQQEIIHRLIQARTEHGLNHQIDQAKDDSVSSAASLYIYKGS